MTRPIRTLVALLVALVPALAVAGPQSFPVTG